VKAVIPFEIDAWDDAPPIEHDGLQIARVQVRKRLTGDLPGTSVVELVSLLVQGAPTAYVALERVDGTLAGKTGSFVFRHVTAVTSEEPPVVLRVIPGSGTGQLAGITGEGTIEIDDDGTHTLTLDYELD